MQNRQAETDRQRLTGIRQAETGTAGGWWWVVIQCGSGPVGAPAAATLLILATYQAAARARCKQEPPLRARALLHLLTVVSQIQR